MTDHAIEKIFLTLARIGKKMGYRGNHTKRSLADDYSAFLERKREFSAPADETIDFVLFIPVLFHSVPFCSVFVPLTLLLFYSVPFCSVLT